METSVKKDTNVSGIPRDAAACIWEGVTPGLEICVCGYMAPGETKRLLNEGLSETALARIPDRIRERVGLLASQAADTAGRAEEILAGIRKKGFELPAKRISGQSIRSILWEIPEEAGLGIDVDLRSIPVRQETVEIFELAGADPYEAPCEALWVIAAPPEAGLIEALTAAGLPAARIGELRTGHDKILRSGAHISFLNRPQDAE